eukprot:snap_masked-scaffold_3-processed-gene-8.27-mRNA-1 protein AED:1.00 eAED:1.00 QI:0/-1/0/0/-1/1/1/0/73
MKKKFPKTGCDEIHPKKEGVKYSIKRYKLEEAKCLDYEINIKTRRVNETAEKVAKDMIFQGLVNTSSSMNSTS